MVEQGFAYGLAVDLDAAGDGGGEDGSTGGVPATGVRPGGEAEHGARLAAPRLTQPSKLSSRGCDAPHISAYIFWDHDPVLCAEKVVARALAHEPFAL
ncbi:hypothetical protein ABZ891_13790 [Streptomyces sp. NPDC047023]|uniref:hypothetical protein n=1 Tax=Streptomyces sp. NPDC047023 TaxID=3155139 RepID=UPI0033FB8176